jgi:hypothetical protein
MRQTNKGTENKQAHKQTQFAQRLIVHPIEHEERINQPYLETKLFSHGLEDSLFAQEHHERFLDDFLNLVENSHRDFLNALRNAALSNVDKQLLSLTKNIECKKIYVCLCVCMCLCLCLLCVYVILFYFICLFCSFYAFGCCFVYFVVLFILLFNLLLSNSGSCGVRNYCRISETSQYGRIVFIFV